MFYRLRPHLLCDNYKVFSKRYGRIGVYFKNLLFAQFLLLLLMSEVAAQQIEIGWLEEVTLNNTNLPVLAKIDTGADNSSIHATDIVLHTKDGAQWVKFILKTDRQDLCAGRLPGRRTAERPDALEMTTTTRPNIIFISAEQQRGDTLHCCGAEWMITPNMDRLASQSVVFERAFSCAATCVSSRAAFYTGLYPHNTGIFAFHPSSGRLHWLNRLHQLNHP